MYFVFLEQVPEQVPDCKNSYLKATPLSSPLLPKVAAM